MRAMITGASSGIGQATAIALSAMGMELIICGRRQDRLETLRQQLGYDRTQVLTFDVGNREAVEAAWDSLPTSWKQVDVLINNAGNAHGRDLVHQGDVADWDAMIDSNVKGLLYVSRLVLPGMVERKHGHIVNIGSLAGKEVYAAGNVYCATKYAVDALTQGMRIDLNGTGVKVSAVHPGLVETEFSMVRFKGDSRKSEQVYSGYEPLKAQDIADIIAFVVSRPPHVNIADLLVLPTAQATSSILHRVL